MDRPHPPRSDVAVGEMGHVEHLAGAVVLLDPEAGPSRIDRDDGCDLAVEALGAIVVAGELELVACAELLLDLCERLGDIGAPAGGPPADRLVLGSNQPHAASIVIDLIHPVADARSGLAAPALAERHHLPGLVAGGALRLGAGEPARLQDGRDQGVVPQRAVANERGANRVGEAFAPGRMTQMVREYIDAADTGKRGSCHLFRHTMATLMLENGADIRFIQAMLGHAELSTIQIYTQVSVRKLKAIHTATHPAKPITVADGGAPAIDIDADLLIAALDAEAAEDDG